MVGALTAVCEVLPDWLYITLGNYSRELNRKVLYSEDLILFLLDVKLQ
jgi:hypothetical protein